MGTWAVEMHTVGTWPVGMHTVGTWKAVGMRALGTGRRWTGTGGTIVRERIRFKIAIAFSLIERDDEHLCVILTSAQTVQSLESNPVFGSTMGPRSKVRSAPTSTVFDMRII